MHESNSGVHTADRKIGSEWTDKMASFRSLGYRSPREIEAAISWSRRQFLRGVSGGAAAAALSACSPLRASGVANTQKVVVVTFGGGTRDEETFQPDGVENIPCLLKEFIPQGTIFTQVVNRGILGHYVATASLVTGVYETFNNFAAVKPDNPTVFEYFRKQRRRPRWWCRRSGRHRRLDQPTERRRPVCWVRARTCMYGILPVPLHPCRDMAAGRGRKAKVRDAAVHSCCSFPS